MGINFTAKSKAQIYGNLQQLFYQQRITLLDHPETLRELRQLERTVTQGGQVQIAAPTGLHDDMATVLALSANQAMNLHAREAQTEARPKSADEVIRERIEEQIRRRADGGAPDTGVWD
jgi:metal-dependent amidase/aminoacylase/carboxypeptidase family protein